MSSILLDTNAYTAYTLSDADVLEAIVRSDEVCISVVTLGELHAGFRNGTQMQKNLRVLRRFLDQPEARVLPVTEATAETYGQLWAACKQRGRPVPTNACGSARTARRRTQSSFRMTATSCSYPKCASGPN